jgi:hypothetical protein
MMALMNGTAAIRQDVLSAIQRLDDRIHGLYDRVQGLDDRVQRLDDRIQGVEVRLTKEIGNVKADLMKWSFLFWVGAVSAIALLAGVLQR